MRQGRNWKHWRGFDLNSQTLIIKDVDDGEPFPIYDFEINDLDFIDHKKGIFSIKTWGTNGYK